MITLGLVLTFTTSWVAYQGVVWNLTIGAPDQIASVLMGSQGSATQVFADRIDILFNAIAETAQATANSGGPQGAQGSFTPGNLMWLSALLLMLGTVGVLVTARIALAVLLGLGPVFITMALFGPTRGLFVGWLRGVLLTALTPLFAVLGGALMAELAVPVVASLRGAEGVDGRAAMALFVLASVHCAVMTLAIRVASTMVAGWRVFGFSGGNESPAQGEGAATASSATSAPSAPGIAATDPRLRAMVAGTATGSLASTAAANTNTAAGAATSRTIIMSGASTGANVRPSRARGIGSRFSSPAMTLRKSLK
jgi:type IV secretion system protein VirB6